MSQLNVNTIKNRVGNSGPTVDGNTTVSGILTATSFSGDGSGLTGLTISGDGDLSNLTVSGVSTFTGNINASSADFSGNVTIGGTLTYRDVTNIDAVGMVTARKGIQVLADGLTVVGVATFNDNVKLLDNDKATFGNDGDLEIYHSSTSSHIVDVGTGNLIIGSDGGALKITKGDDTENMAVFTPDGAAELYYDNSKKLETTTDGVTVTGGVQLGTGTTISSPASNQFIVSTNGSERVRVESSGRLLVGTNTARANFFNGSFTGALQVEGTTYDTTVISSTINSNDSDPIITLARSRGTSVGSNTIVQSGDGLGRLIFQGSDGTEFVQGASISGESDGTPGANDMPGRLVFLTTADGAVTPTERMRIASDGVITAKNGTVAEIDTLTDASTVTPDFAASTNFTLTFTSAVGNSRTIANPSNLTAGQSGSIFLIQDSTGSRTVSWGSYWDWAGGTAPTLTTTGSAVDRIDYIVRTSTSIHAVATLAYS